MKNKTQFLPALFVLLGLAACAAYRTLLTSSLDALGLFLPWSVPQIVLAVLTAAAVAGAFLLSRGCRLGDGAGFLPAIGDLVFAAGVLTLTQTQTCEKSPAAMQMLLLVFSYAAAASLAGSAIVRFLKKTPHFLLTVAPCILCLLHLVECYQLWSEIPQLLEYGLGVGAVLMLNLFAYHRMARSAALPYLPLHFAYGLLGIFFCIAAIPMGTYRFYFLGAACWMTADLTALAQEE